MRKYNRLKLQDGLSIEVVYDYYPMEISKNIELPNEPALIENIIIPSVNGNLEDFALFIDDKNGKFFDWLEAKLYELND